MHGPCRYLRTEPSLARSSASASVAAATATASAADLETSVAVCARSTSCLATLISFDTILAKLAALDAKGFAISPAGIAQGAKGPINAAARLATRVTSLIYSLLGTCTLCDVMIKNLEKKITQLGKVFTISEQK